MSFFGTMCHYSDFYKQVAKNLSVQGYSGAVNPVVAKNFEIETDTRSVDIIFKPHYSNLGCEW